LLLKQILRRNTVLLPAPLRALYPATICFRSIFELATGLQTAKIGLTAAWPQAHFSSSAGCPNCARSRNSQKVLPVFCLKNTQWLFGQQAVYALWVFNMQNLFRFYPEQQLPGLPQESGVPQQLPGTFGAEP
jgi:hypothetical protein